MNELKPTPIPFINPNRASGLARCPGEGRDGGRGPSVSVVRPRPPAARHHRGLNTHSTWPLLRGTRQVTGSCTRQPWLCTSREAASGGAGRGCRLGSRPGLGGPGEEAPGAAAPPDSSDSEASHLGAQPFLPTVSCHGASGGPSPFPQSCPKRGSLMEQKPIPQRASV